MKVEIWSDIMCPFCYIGKRNFEAALNNFPNKELIEVEWKSFQLDPTIPEKLPQQASIYEYVAERKGMSYEQSRELHQQVIQYANSVGLTYNFDKAIVANSLNAHQIIQFAKAKGLGDQAEERFFYAYFTEGKNLGDISTLKELGKEIGLAEVEVDEALTNPVYVQKVHSEVNDAQALGLRGVPFFVINRKYGIAGAQQPAEIGRALEKAFGEWQHEHASSTKI